MVCFLHPPHSIKLGLEVQCYRKAALSVHAADLGVLPLSMVHFMILILVPWGMQPGKLQLEVILTPEAVQRVEKVIAPLHVNPFYTANYVAVLPLPVLQPLPSGPLMSQLSADLRLFDHSRVVSSY